MAIKKPVMKPVKPMGKPMPKPKAAPMPAGRMRYDDPDQKKPNPQGLYNDQGYMDQVPGKAPKVTIQKKGQVPADTDAAKRAGYKR